MSETRGTLPVNAEGDSGGRWTRRLSVLVALVITGGLGAGLALLVAPGAGSASVWPEPDNQGPSPAHVSPDGDHLGLYTYDSNTCNPNSRSDPINIIFHGPFGESRFVNAHASDSSHGGWSDHPSTDQYFLDHGQCEVMDGTNADGPDFPPTDRWHMRYNQGPDVDPVWEQYTVAAAHHEDFIFPACHAVDGNDNDPPGGFNKGRVEIWFKWTQEATDPHVNTWQEDWDNVKRFKQCDNDFAWSNGLVFHIEIACTGVDPAVGFCDPDTSRVSESSYGEEGNDDSFLAAINSDGRFVAFDSQASNLVAGDTNGSRDVFVRDRATGVTERVSVDSNGGEGNGMSFLPAISSDGRFVAFESWASNLVQPDTNNASDIFVHDRLTGITERVSVDSGGGQGNGPSDGSAISADGRFVAFVSSATNLVPEDSNGKRDIFVHDRETGITGRVSVDSGGGQANAVHPGTFAGDHCEDPDADGLFDLDDPCPDNPDCDGDSQGLGDAFGLFLRDGVEVFMGTLVTVACAATPAADDEDPDALGPDWDDSQGVDGSDLFLFAERFGTELGVPPPVGKQPYWTRFDIYPTAASLNKIDGSDLFVLASYFGDSCP